jgi:hypothetical protein
MIRGKYGFGKSAALTLALTTALLSGCGKNPQSAAPASPAPAAVTEPAAPVKPARQVGERFEGSFTFQGMAEKVQYEHIRSDAVGFEMDFDYESFKRISEAERERFVSVWDDPAKPENYIDVSADTEKAELVADAITAQLSGEYDVTSDTRTLDSGAQAIRLEASVLKGTNLMGDNLQSVYIIPASDGCRVAWVHCVTADSEGFTIRVSKMLNTLTAVDRK